MDYSSGEDRFRRFICSETLLLCAGVRPFWRKPPPVLFFPCQQEGAVPSSPFSSRSSPNCAGASSSIVCSQSARSLLQQKRVFDVGDFVKQDVSGRAVCAQRRKARLPTAEALPATCLLQCVIVPRMFPFRVLGLPGRRARWAAARLSRGRTGGPRGVVWRCTTD